MSQPMKFNVTKQLNYMPLFIRCRNWSPMNMRMIYIFSILGILVVAEAASGMKSFVRTFEQKPEAGHASRPMNASNFKTVYYVTVPNTPNVSKEDPILPGVNVILCTHLIFIPSIVDGNNHMVTKTPAQASFYQLTIPAMKRQNPKLIVMISNALNPTQMSPIMGSLQNTTEYVNSAVVFLRKYGFDGLDLDWEFPTHAQYQNYSRVLTELRKAFEDEATKSKKPRLLLTTAVLTGAVAAPQIYDFKGMQKALDFVNMMGYDLMTYSKTDSKYKSNLGRTGFNSPLPALASDANYWASKMGKDKVVVGIPFYNHAFKLLFSELHGLGAMTIGRGDCENTGMPCVCNALNNKNATIVFDGKNKAPYCYYGDQWVTFENRESIYYKTKWILENGFPGLMVWTMQSDDDRGVCYGIKHPLMKTVVDTINIHFNNNA